LYKSLLYANAVLHLESNMIAGCYRLQYTTTS